MSITVCIPTLNAKEEFWACVKSVEESSFRSPIFAIDNGGWVGDPKDKFMVVHHPVSNLGVAGSWNWFLDHVPEVRLITNDDIIFDKECLMQMAYCLQENDRNNLIVPENLDSPFSCFIIPQQVVDRVGKFDEWISPKYAYFEDNDYSHRMSMAGVGIIRAKGAFVQHAGSSTIKHFSAEKERLHHEKFRLARSHYIKKWGGEPGQEKYTSPFGL